ncbi:MAG: single-stranded-DNA-specific exonuclease RecJ [Alphaproteobacteria bacterium]
MFDGLSVSGRRWLLRAADDRLALTLAQRHDLPEPAARVLAGRGIGLAEAADFLAPTLRRLLPDPSTLADMDAAAGRLADAVQAGQAIALFGDYDVDGATSTALLRRFFAAVGAPATVMIPDRLTEGYGPTSAAMNRLAADGARLVITLDCGITAYGALETARDAGLDVVVVDHHAAEPKLPPAAAVVNPNRLDDTSGQGRLAAVGVAFLVAVATARELRRRGHFIATGRPEPDLMQWLDLVALGTVCDMVPLTGLNRALVAQGLKVMRRRANAGLAALADVAGLDATPDSGHLGFLLGPRVNAGGRVGQSATGSDLLASDDPVQAAALARRLDDWNRERQTLEAATVEDALALVEREVAAHGGHAACLFIARAGWHAGVIGLVASRLVERYARPAVVIALDDSGQGKGSARSIAGVDIGAAIIAARQKGLLLNGGGHPMAAGLTVAADKLEALRDFLAERIARVVTDRDLTPELTLDGALRVPAADRALWQSLSGLGPFGIGNGTPRFAVLRARFVTAEPVGRDGAHIRAILSDETGRGRLKAIAFRAGGQPLGQAMLAAARDGLGVALAGTLRADDWQGREGVQLIVEDVMTGAPQTAAS